MREFFVIVSYVALGLALNFKINREGTSRLILIAADSVADVFKLMGWPFNVPILLAIQWMLRRGGADASDVTDVTERPYLITPAMRYGMALGYATTVLIGVACTVMLLKFLWGSAL